LSKLCWPLRPATERNNRKIANAIHAKIKKASDSQEYHVGHLADTRKEVQRKKRQLEEARQFGVGDVFGLLLGISYDVRKDPGRNALNRAEQQLQHIQEEETKIDKELYAKKK
jgi:hypothetical protein